MGVMLTNNNAFATVAFCRLPIGERKLPSSCQSRGGGELLETTASLHLFETWPEWHQPCLHPRPQGQLYLAKLSWSYRRPPQPRPIFPWICRGRAGLPGSTHHAACHSWASWGGRGARGGGRFISLSKVRRTCFVYSCSFIVPSCRPGRINIAQLDPSLSLAFLCKTEQEFDNLCIGIQVCTDGVDKNPFASEGQTTGLHNMLIYCFELFFYSGGGVETVFCSSLWDGCGETCSYVWRCWEQHWLPGQH